MVQQKCQHKMARSNNKMSIQERINELLEAPDIKSLVAEWQESFLKLGSTPHQRLECMLSMEISQMSKYSDPVVRSICKDPEYVSLEDQEMDRIISWRPTFLVLDKTLNAGTVAKYAWLYEIWEDLHQKAKAKQTLDHVTNLGHRYINDMLRVSVQGPSVDALRSFYYTEISEDEHKVIRSDNTISIVDYDPTNRFLEAPDTRSLITEWQLSFIRLGSTPDQRLRRVLSMEPSQMLQYSDPVARAISTEPESLSREHRNMDRILKGTSKTLSMDGTLNAVTITKYAWLQKHCLQPELKIKALRTFNHLIEVGKSYLNDQQILSTPVPKSNQTLEIKEPDPHLPDNGELIQPENEATDQFIHLDLAVIRQSVYNLIDRYPDRVLFLEYLISNNDVDNMTASQYKNQYLYYLSEYDDKPQMVTKTIQHKGIIYDFRITTFKGQFRGIETLAMAFGYPIVGLNLITIYPKRL